MARFKLDENFGASIQQLFSGHDCHTVREEGLGGATDTEVFGAAARESRILVTLDLDFANVLAFPPKDSNGIIVIRPTKGSPTLQLLQSLIRQTLVVLQTKSVAGRLWIVEPGRIREHVNSTDDF